jgi:hypothetical protein
MVFKRKKKTTKSSPAKVKVDSGENYHTTKEIQKPERYDMVLESAKEVIDLIPKVCTTGYSCTNAYVILQNAIKKLRLANY